MNKNVMIVLGGGFMIALLVAIIVQASFGKKESKVEIAVAAQALLSASKKRRMTTDVQISSVLQEINRNKRKSGGASNIVRVYSGDTVENVTVRQ